MSNFAKDTLTNKRPARRIRTYGGAIALLLALNQIVTTSVYADDQPRAAESNAIRRMNEQMSDGRPPKVIGPISFFAHMPAMLANPVLT